MLSRGFADNTAVMTDGTVHPEATGLGQDM